MLMTSADSVAKLQYGPSDFRVLKAGNHVLCAVTGEAIPLESLRYWSARHQEAYVSAEVATRRLLDQV